MKLNITYSVFEPGLVQYDTHVAEMQVTYANVRVIIFLLLLTSFQNNHSYAMIVADQHIKLEFRFQNIHT